jgi:hypothetical protein
MFLIQIDNEHFIYRMKQGDYYISIAIAQKATVNIFNLSGANIRSYLD